MTELPKVIAEDSSVNVTHSKSIVGTGIGSIVNRAAAASNVMKQKTQAPHLNGALRGATSSNTGYNYNT